MMSGMVSKVLLVALLLIGDSAKSEEVLCSKGQALCSRTCFTPQTQHCLDNVVCQKDEASSVCDGVCIARTSKKVCIPAIQGRRKSHYPTEIRQTLCDVGQGACEGRCYSNLTDVCLVNTQSVEVLCSKGQVLCGVTCFNAEEFEHKQCLIEPQEGGGFLCEKNERVCYSGCYSPVNHTCVGYELCEVGHVCEQTTQGLRYEEEYTTGFPTPQTCEAGEVQCGFSCFVPLQGKVCLNNSTVCEAGQTLCGSKCYTRGETVRCIDNQLILGCQANSEICRPEAGAIVGCYDPKTHVCLYSGDEYKHLYGDNKVICMKEQVACGDKCFQPKTQVCISRRAQQDGNIHYSVCSSGQLLCGGTEICYNPQDQVCLDNQFLCNKGEGICQYRCYNLKSHVCFTY